MKTNTSILLFIGAFVTTGLSSTIATAAAPDYKWQVKDQTASGWAFEYGDCESTSVYIYGSESSTHAGGPPVKDNSAYAGFSSYNGCTGDQTDGWGWVANAFIGNMNEASIHIVFEADSWGWVEIEGDWVYSYLGTRTVEIDAEFTGFGKAAHGVNNSTNHWGSSFTHYRSVGQSRDATLDLEVTLDGQPVALSNAEGDLGRANSGTIEKYE